MCGECDLCGLHAIECQCYVHELEERITFIEEELDVLTTVVNSISEYLKERDLDKLNK